VNNTTKKHLILGIMLSVLLVLVAGCGGKKAPPPPPPPPPPVTATLSANPATIQSGQSSTLQWSTQNATDVTLDGNKVDPSGSQSVSPRQTTTYHLVAKGAGGTQEAPATITVTAPPPPPPTPTPAPTPSMTDDQLLAQTLSDVYFDYDKSDLRPDAQQMLSRAAPVIASHPNWTIRIEGNCDDRGSTEYNLALGERRASAAQQALVQGGVNASQLKTVSYGKEKPVCTEATEDCWQRNRRDHFVLVH
jgi:peptidoglycan-associated lipoprotein